MARKRLRQNWPQRVFKFWLRPVEQIPHAVHTEAQAMVNLWNSLVEISNKNRQAYNELMERNTSYSELQIAIERKKDEVDEAVDDWRYQRKIERKRTSPDIKRLAKRRDELKEEIKELRERRKALGACLRRQYAEQMAALWDEFNMQKESMLGSADVYWANMEAIEQSFETTFKRGLKTGNFPHKHNMSHPWRFAHRFTGGGVPIDKLFAGRSNRVHIESVPPTAYDTSIPQRQRKRLARTSVTIMLAGESVTFHTILHRPIPQEAIVKRVEIVQRKQANKSKWHMCITVEEPPACLTPRNEIKQIVWIYDLPQNGLVAEYGNNTIRLPERLRKQIRKIDHLKSHMDQHTNTAKEYVLKNLSPDELPEEMQCVFNSWHKARHKRIWDINRLLKQLEIRSDLVSWLDTWERSHRKLYHAWSGLQPRAIRHREWYYHQSVNDILLLAKGGTIIVNDRPRLKWGRKTLAAPSQLRDMLRAKAERYGVQVIFVNQEEFETQKRFAKNDKDNSS